jgi:hypothetical protein
MAAQQTLNASRMQACRSSVVSATALEAKRAIARAAIGGASAFITVNAFKVCSPDRQREGRALRSRTEAADDRLKQCPLARSTSTLDMDCRYPYGRGATVDKNREAGIPDR